MSSKPLRAFIPFLMPAIALVYVVPAVVAKEAGRDVDISPIHQWTLLPKNDTIYEGSCDEWHYPVRYFGPFAVRGVRIYEKLTTCD